MIAESVENLPINPRIGRKITLRDAEDMARLIAKRITERGACLQLGINPLTWYKWKSKRKNAPKFADIVEHVREVKLLGVIDDIERSGEPTTVITDKGKSWTRPGDWRAKAWIAERVLAPERFGQQVSSVTVNQSAITVQLGGDDALRRLIAEAARVALAGSQALPPAQEPVRQLTEGQSDRNGDPMDANNEPQVIDIQSQPQK